jgi:DNA-binding NarL/FixJ family response regulator
MDVSDLLGQVRTPTLVLHARDDADRLAISEKTVRNHTTNVFDKLGVWSRAHAIVFARDHGFR